jgi:hypothetical protein
MWVLWSTGPLIEKGLLLSRPLEPEARSESGLQFVGAITAGMTILAGLSWPLSHQTSTQLADRHFREQFDWFATQVALALSKTKALQTALDSKQLSGQDWARQINADVLPIWQGTKDRLIDASPPRSSQLRVFRRALLNYIDDRIVAMSWLADGMAKNSADDMVSGQAALRRAEEAARDAGAYTARRRQILHCGIEISGEPQ